MPLWLASSPLVLASQSKVRRAVLEAYFRLGRALGFDNNFKEAQVWLLKMQDLAERSRDEGRQRADERQRDGGDDERGQRRPQIETRPR